MAEEDKLRQERIEETEEPAVSAPAARPEGEKGTPASKEKERPEEAVYNWGQALIAAVVSVVLLFTFVARLISVSGPSMQDTLYTGDRMLVINSFFCRYEPGDVVVINAYNADLDETLVKRVIAVGGQTVDVDFVTGTVYVDGEPLDEPYVKEPTYTPEGVSFPLTLEEDQVFVMGDNRNHSTDSRDPRLGPINVGYIQGKAVALLFPGKDPVLKSRQWSRIGLIH